MTEEPIKRSNLRVKFFKDGKQDMVETSIVGDTSTLIEKVTPAHLATFPQEWAAYENGQEYIDHGGTALTEVPGIDKNIETAYRLKGVHNVEQFVELSEAAVKSLGMGAMTAWQTAKLLIASKEQKAMSAIKDFVDSGTADQPKRGPGRPPKQPDTEAA